VRVALDEQIFAIQPFGGISRLFYEKASAFVRDSTLGVSVDPLNSPVINEYLLGDPELSAALGATRSSGAYVALARYFVLRDRTSAVDVVHNTFYLPRGLGGHPGAKRVVTIYDMIPELLPQTRRRMDFLTEKHKYVQQADHVVCISESTRNDLLRMYPDIHAPITIAYPGVGAQFSPSAPNLAGLPEPYVLHVGNRGSYKDGETLFRAFAVIASDFPEVTLFLVGGGALSKGEKEVCASLGIINRIEQRSIHDSDMPSVYAQALVTVFPSRYEGFGLPAVEALACGCPLVLADTSSLPEIGGEAAHYFPPGDDKTLAEIMRSLLESEPLRNSMREIGFSQAAKFTWHGYAQANARAYQAALES
jgi:glycosyltransferase involved in cell wall biosynthesis